MWAIDVIDRLNALGCAIRVEGEKLKVRGPNLPEVTTLVAELHARREEAIPILQDLQSKPPTLEEIQAVLPPTVKIVSYQPKQVPFEVSPISIVNDAGKFFRSYLRDLAWRLANPKGLATAPLPDILSKLEEAGLKLKVEDLLCVEPDVRGDH